MTVLRHTKQAGLKLNDKCVFFTNELSFLGHKVMPNGIILQPEKVESIKNIPAPVDAASLQFFLELVEYYTKFISNLADVVDPTQAVLRMNKPFVWP